MYRLSLIYDSSKLRALPTQRQDVHILEYLNLQQHLCKNLISFIFINPTFAMSSRSKAWVCGLSLAGIAGSNPAGVMDVCLL
jgi:hypothetical protein